MGNTTETRLTKLQILEETAKSYTKSNRSINEFGDCVYYDKATGNKCAVGRCLREPEKFGSSVFDLQTVWDVWVTDTDKYSDKLDADLKPEYRGHSVAFWEYVQRLHDTVEFWCETGLSPSGEKYLDELRAKWQNSE